MSKKTIYKSKKEKVVSRPDKKAGYIRDLGTATYISAATKRREFGAHLTSIDIFRRFIHDKKK